VFLFLLTAGDRFRPEALCIFAIMAITDFLDGYLARKFNQVSRVGTFLDPTADKLLITGSLLILCIPRFAPARFDIPWPVLLGIFMKDVCVLIGAAVVKYKLGKVEINANLPGKVNTTLEISVVIATLLAPEWIAISPLFAAVFLWLLWHLTVLATAWSGMGYSYEGARQLRAANAAARRKPDHPAPI
jgi:CDP-diacylglycerol--glycerol-3-phosphate 3-phosphatidyltransferase